MAEEDESSSKRGVTWDKENIATSTRTGFSGLKATSERQRMQEERISLGRVFLPWDRSYKTWWGFTVLLSFLTALFTTYQVAFLPAGLVPTDAADVIEYFFVGVFIVDIVVSFNLAYENEGGQVIYDHRLVARNYLRRMFWIDLIGVFPFYAIALACAGLIGQDTQITRFLTILQLFRLVRLHRVKQLITVLQYNSKVSLMWLTLCRNFGVALLWSHFNACAMFFIARQSSFDEENTWIGGDVAGLNVAQQYVTSLYWSVVTFTTVGYGDFSPVNTAEQIWGVIYMLLNIIIASWIIGSMTLLIVKGDARTGLYRDTLQVLDQYCEIHSFDKAFHKRLKTQLKLDFHNREVADEQVLQYFPSSVRCKALRTLYLRPLFQTSLMKGLRQQFIDAFLVACRVEIFSPGDEILQRGSIPSDLYLIIEGVVKLVSTTSDDQSLHSTAPVGGYDESVTDSEFLREGSGHSKRLGSGDFINDIGFFTESPQIATVRTVTICKTLTMSKSAYKQIAEDHPSSVGKILKNLLSRVEEEKEDDEVYLPTRIEVLNAGSEYDTSQSAHNDEVQHTVASVQKEAALSSVQDLIKMHISKQKDDHTTRFLYAAARGDTTTITLMCDHGFDPNDSDYDCRTALMVAAMKGNTEVVKLLLEDNANPNLVDMTGSSALYEAAKYGHETTMQELLHRGAKLCMDEGKAASTLCQAVFDGDILILRRLLKAGIQVNAGDYDKRTAVHIAAAEGNVAALKVLIEFGADMTVRDRWNNTVDDEAKRAGATQVLKMLRTAGTGGEDSVDNEAKRAGTTQVVATLRTAGTEGED